jgi:hypothetical protein
VVSHFGELGLQETEISRYLTDIFKKNSSGRLEAVPQGVVLQGERRHSRRNQEALNGHGSKQLQK